MALLLGVFLFGVWVYGFDLGGLYIPSIGDETPYIEITRLSAESGTLLPLRTPEGLENTKPPLLFWLGIESTNWGRHFSLERLRAPIVVVTFLIATFVFVLTRRLSGEKETAFVGCLIYLGFHSSYQYGRPFLTNAPETLFVFLPMFLLMRFPDRRNGWALWGVAGVSLGVACLFKSFALVVPVGLALGGWALYERDFRLADAIREDARHIVLAVLVGLAIFFLWPLADPDPGAIFRHFVLEENLGKLSRAGYLGGLFTGPYPLYRIWLGVPLNAGLYALPVLYLGVTSLVHRKTLGREERILWVFVLSFLLVYSIPSQRQENYLLPVMPAVAVLIALRWKQIPPGWLRAFFVPVLSVVALLAWLMAHVGADVLPAGTYRPWQWLVLGTVFGLGLSGLAMRGAARFIFPAVVLGAYFSLSCALVPFHGALGHFAPERVAWLRGKRVFVPSPRLFVHEKHRFLLPGVRIEPYDPADVNALSRLLDSGAIVVVRRPVGSRVHGPFRILGRRYHLRSRQSLAELESVLATKHWSVLVQEELILRRYRGERLRADR